VKFSCEKCGRSYVADEKVRGRAFKMKCKQCGYLIVVKPDHSAPTPAPGTLPAVEATTPTSAAFALDAPAADPFAAAPDPFAAPPADPFKAAAPDPFAAPPAPPARSRRRSRPSP
jgi:DNA-directed RNA polymerase subunit RPC12/RpoP